MLRRQRRPHIMSGVYDRDAAPRFVVENSSDHRVGSPVQPCGRLVEQQQVGLLRESASDQHSVALPAGEFADLRVGKVADFHPVHRLGHDGTVAGQQRPPRASVRPSPYGDDVAHGHRQPVADADVLAHVREPTGHTANSPGGRSKDAGDHVEQCRLTGTVGTEDRVHDTAPHACRYTAQGRGATVTGCDGVQFDVWRLSAQHCFTS